MSEANGYTEAPLSCSVKALSPNGFDIIITMRDDNPTTFKKRVNGFLSWLEESGFEPIHNGRYIPNPPATNGNSANVPDPTPEPDWCPIHRVQMKRREKDGQVWYSHKAGNEWCRGRE